MAITLPAFAKINLDLRILGTRPDGYHDLKTIFQSLALHDDVTLTARKGPFAIECDDPDVPTDERNLVWKAAHLLWQVAGKRRVARPANVVIGLRKRVPSAAGLGGGSADAAVALVGLVQLWDLRVDLPTLSRVASAVGSDVAYFLAGGTALGLGRGDDVYPLVDLPRTYVVVVRPHFGVSTADAYGWFDTEPRRSRKEPVRRPLPPEWPHWAAGLHNDLEPVVVRHHPAVGRIVQALVDAGAVFAAMSGSGSAVFGLFDRLDAARRTAADLTRPGWLVVSTRTLSRAEYRSRLGPALAQLKRARIS